MKHHLVTHKMIELKQASALPSSTQPTSNLSLAEMFSGWGVRIGTALDGTWAYALTVLLGLIILLAILVPVLSYLGLDVVAKPLFLALHTICAQIPSHSFYLFGHQLGLCERNLAIYGSMFLGSLVFAITKKRLPGIPWWFWLLLALPMIVDGTTQMFGWRESTWVLRVITGTLFGGGTTWFVLPLVQRFLRETTLPRNSGA